ncbi:MarR family transcriptional regulator [Stappia sp. F7233]|uniref:MarR family transcriptional regulator n=1 Tax=Stappia albiluteola TaxID=2758565 RepID=A0A839A9H0_9HYPH|nr:MarR family transcriptional regulator [Stappia albiluteola]MBA5776011.1 MarR family transcriptional regulator [Stappia albiluteola]
MLTKSDARKSDAWLKLVQVVGHIETDIGKAMQDKHGLGLSEYRALEVLARSPDSELRMQELATHLRLNQSSISRLVERLERAELTLRDLCPDDKRGVYTVLTDKGRARLESAQADYSKALNAAIKKHGCEDLLSAKLIAPSRSDQ